MSTPAVRQHHLAEDALAIDPPRLSASADHDDDDDDDDDDDEATKYVSLILPVCYCMLALFARMLPTCEALLPRCW